MQNKKCLVLVTKKSAAWDSFEPPPPFCPTTRPIAFKIYGTFNVVATWPVHETKFGPDRLRLFPKDCVFGPHKLSHSFITTQPEACAVRMPIQAFSISYFLFRYRRLYCPVCTRVLLILSFLLITQSATPRTLCFFVGFFVITAIDINYNCVSKKPDRYN